MGLLALAIVVLMLVQCKKEDSSLPSAGKPTAQESTTKEAITAAKVWLAEQQAASVKSGGAVQLADAERIDWDNSISGTDGHTIFLPIATDNKQVAKYLKVTTGSNGSIATGNYVYLYSTMNKQADAYLLEGKKVPTEFSGTMLEYSLHNQLLASKVYENGHAAVSKTAKLALKPASDKLGGNTAAARAECTAYYLQTYMDGVLVSEVYLYTICVKEPDEALITEDGGGGTIDETAALMAEFNNHIKSTSSPASASTPGTTPDPNPVSYTHTWRVIEGAIVPWRVEATTRIDYFHNKYYDLQLNAIEHRYNIAQLKTFNTQYVGTNIVANTIWTETAVRDDILNNNTAQAYGKSSVFGKIRHRMIVPPGVTMPLVPDFEQNVGNFCTTTPK